MRWSDKVSSLLEDIVNYGYFFSFNFPVYLEKV